MTAQTTAFKDLSIEEMEAALQKRKDAQRRKEERDRKQYVKERDERIHSIFDEGRQLTERLSAFKQKLNETMEIQHEKLTEYGKIRKNSKGGFSITDEKGLLRVVRARDTNPEWDERGEKGAELIRDFLGTVVKKRDKKLYELLLGLLERNKEGALKYSALMHLLQHENKWDDKRWVEGLRLIKESYRSNFSKYYYELKMRGTDGSWKSINLNFSSL